MSSGPRQNPFSIIGQIESVVSSPREEMLILSPCDECQNFLSEEVGPGQTVCPRRQWIDRKAADPGTPDYLAASGTDDPEKLTNPVSANDTLLVWAAAVSENRGVSDQNGDLLTPGILDPAFDTRYIRCRSLPYVPQDGQSTWFQLATMYDKLTPLRQRHLHGTALRIHQEDPNQIRQPVMIAGFIRRSTFPFYWSLQTPQQDRIASGF